MAKIGRFNTLHMQVVALDMSHPEIVEEKKVKKKKTYHFDPIKDKVVLP
jgi:hypothetical protein